MRAEAVRGRAGVCSSVDFPKPLDFSRCLTAPLRHQVAEWAPTEAGGVCLFDFSEGLTCPLGSAVTGEKRPRWARRVMFAELVLQVVCVPLV